jgi:hypothetical protein
MEEIRIEIQDEELSTCAVPPFVSRCHDDHAGEPLISLPTVGTRARSMQGTKTPWRSRGGLILIQTSARNGGFPWKTTRMRRSECQLCELTARRVSDGCDIAVILPVVGSALWVKANVPLIAGQFRASFNVASENARHRVDRAGPATRHLDRHHQISIRPNTICTQIPLQVLFHQFPRPPLPPVQNRPLNISTLHRCSPSAPQLPRYTPWSPATFNPPRSCSLVVLH